MSEPETRPVLDTFLDIDDAPPSSTQPQAPTTTDESVTAPTANEPEPTATPAEDDKSSAIVDDDEPQNGLTNQFTDEEWRALKQLRNQLPEIFTKAYHPDESPAKLSPITLWGVTIDPEAPKSDAKVSVILMKFLRARNLSVTDAHTMLVATLRWRDQFKVDEIMKEEFDQSVFGMVGHVFGKDKEGRPVNYNLYGGHNIKNVFSDVPRFIRWRVQLMERSIQLLDFENIDQMIQVHDYAGVGLLAGRDANQKAAASEATNIFQNHYPEFLALKFFINVPTFLTWMFWLFKPLIPAKTFSKMSVVGTSKGAIASALLPVVDEEELPERYGGKAGDFAQ